MTFIETYTDYIISHCADCKNCCFATEISKGCIKYKCVNFLPHRYMFNPFTPGCIKWIHQALNLGQHIDQKRGVSQKTPAEWQTA